VFGYIKVGNAPLQVIKGAGRAHYEFEGVKASDPVTFKLHDGFDQAN
jgi:hypothetical protein